jgi:nucleoside-diphosphate-sugar epimerase
MLVTGASGFIGRHCLPRLIDAGFDVHATARTTGTSQASGATWHHADLLDDAQVDGLMRRVRPTHLLHLAWDVNTTRWTAAGAHLEWARAGLSLVRSFAEQGGTRAVMAGTCAEYDWNVGLCRESQPATSPATMYGSAKRALGVLATAYGAATDVAVVWPRIFFTYGPHEPPGRLVPSVVRALLRGERALCTYGLQRRDYLHVSDVADALALLARHDLIGAVNVGSGVAVEVRAIAIHIAERLGRPDLLALGALPDGPDSAALVVADTGLLQEGLSWRPRISLESGLDETIAWWRGVEHADAGRDRT